MTTGGDVAGGSHGWWVLGGESEGGGVEVGRDHQEEHIAFQSVLWVSVHSLHVCSSFSITCNTVIISLCVIIESLLIFLMPVFLCTFKFLSHIYLSVPMFTVLFSVPCFLISSDGTHWKNKYQYMYFLIELLDIGM